MKNPVKKSSFPTSQKLFQRATQVIPRGIYGHASPAATLAGQSPYYAERAQGCRYWDVDGRSYIDYLCGYGPILLGYGHPEVEEAAERQRRSGDCFNHPTARMVELAEYLVAEVNFAGWAVFAKNGSDVTTWAIQVARHATKRKKILLIEGAYHGIDPWCTPGKAGLIEEDRQHIHTFPWNDLNRFEDLIKQYRNEIAGVIVTPFHHPAFGDSVMPAEGFFKQIESTCKREGMLLILDDIRAGFRLHEGGSHRVFGFEPDMICFCKALGNGYPISAALGRENLRLPASKVFLTGSYWNGAVSMAAALACLKIVKRDNVIPHLEKMGTLLMTGLTQLAKERGKPIVCTGPPAIPFMRFQNEHNFFQMQAFCSAAIARGIYFHPHHNWFLSAAHQREDIEETLTLAKEALHVL